MLSPQPELFFGAARLPLRTCVLITGERFHGELLRADRTAVEFRWHGHTRFRVPTAAVAAIENPPGAVDVLDQRLSGEELRTFEVEPVADGLAQLWWQPPPERETGDPVPWQLQFGDADLVLSLRPNGHFDVTLPPDWTIEFRQPVRPPAAETCLAVRWTATTWDVRIGPALMMRGGKPPDALDHVSIDAPSPGTMDHLTIRRFTSDRRSRSNTETTGPLDAVIRAEGDVWYGEFLRTTIKGIELRGEREAVAVIPWTEFAVLRLRSRDQESEALPPITGRVAEFVGPAAWEPWRLERERWIAADVAPWFASSVVEHPLLGHLRLANGDVDHRVATYPRTWQWLHPAAVHLGNNIEPDYAELRPLGTRLSGTLILTAPPTRPTAISLDVVGLEPCGPGTPSTERFLSELQSGALRTELRINDVSVGDWNSLLTHRPQPGHPTRLRLSVPSERWRPGHNTWEIRQHPRRDDAMEFDDCELSRIAFESD